MLAGALSGDRTYAVRCRQGRFVVKHWQPEDTGYARRSAVLQEALRAAGAPLPAHIRTRGGHLVVRDTTVREFASGRVLSSWSSEQAEVFGQALGRLDRALADCPVDSFYLNQPSVFSRCKDIEQVAGRYLPACDGRFPSGYRGHLVATLERLTSRLSEIADQRRILTHVDPNPENAISGAAGQVTLIDLTPEVHPPGYSLGAALYSWAYPWRNDELNLNVVRAMTRAYLRHFPLSPPLRRAIADHMLNHSMMELAFPLGCLVDGPPLGARPMEDLEGRLRRACRLLGSIEDVERALLAS